MLLIRAFTGSSSDPDELRQLRATRGLVADGVRSQTFRDQQQIFDSPYGVERHYWKGHFVHELPDELIESRTLDGNIQELIYRPTLHG